MTVQPRYKLGKRPARTGAIKLRFSAYLDRSELPKHPISFGHERLVNPRGWGMFANDQYGDCFWAGAAHEHRMWNYEASRPLYFTDKAVLSSYSEATGFDPSKPETDQGTDMQAGAKYRRDTGILDAHGKRHKIGAYLAIDAGNLEQHLQAAWLFGAVGIGVELPTCAQDQFGAGKPWDISTSPGGNHVEGGHYIPLVAERADGLRVVTWGATQTLTHQAFAKWNDESIVYLSDEALVNGKSPEAFDYATLRADLAMITKAGLA